MCQRPPLGRAVVARQALGVEKVVVVAVELADGAERFFLTWGRIQDAIDDRPLAELVLRHAVAYDLGGSPVSARVCRSLQEARDQPYFFEALFDFANEGIPSGPDFDDWRNAVARDMEQGKHLWYLGR